MNKRKGMKAFYVESLEGRMHRKFELPAEAVALALSLCRRSKDSGDAFDFLCEIEDKFDALAFDAMFADNKPAKILAALEDSGSFCAHWEEGAHAISVVSESEAKHCVAMLEVEAVCDSFVGR